jgi:ABC-2 type transport system permease protein
MLTIKKNPFNDFVSVLKFELKFRKKQKSFYFISILNILLGFFLISSDSFKISGPNAMGYKNSPFMISALITLFVLFGSFAIANVLGSSAARDYKFGSEEFFFTQPISKHSFFWGRFAGGTIVSIIIFTLTLIGICLGTFAPWIDKDKIMPFNFESYFRAFFMFLLPNVIIFGSLFYSLAIKFRKKIMATMGALGIIFLSLFSSAITMNIETRFLRIFFDITGMGVLSESTKYWTIYQFNTMQVPINKFYILNRLTWLSLSFIILVFTFSKFKFILQSKRDKRKKISKNSTNTDFIKTHYPSKKISGFRSFFNMVLFETKLILKAPSFLIITMFFIIIAISNFFILFVKGGRLYGVPLRPTSSNITELLTGNLLLFVLIMAIILVGNSVFREREKHINEFFLTVPVKNISILSGKFTAVIISLSIALSSFGFLAIFFQLIFGTKVHLFIYFAIFIIKILIGLSIPFIIAFFFIQTLSPNKFAGYIISIISVIFVFYMDKLHIYKSIYKYALNSISFLNVSDFTVSGIKATLAMSLMWLSLGIILLIFTKALWVKNYDKIKNRIIKGIKSFSKTDYTVLTIFFLIFFSLFSYFYYILYLKKPWFSPEKERKFSAYYEKTYKRFENIPVPKPIDSDFKVDIYPKKGALHTKAVIVFKNSSPFLIKEQLLNIPSPVGNKIIKFKITKPFDTIKTEIIDGGKMIMHIKFKSPLKPEEKFKMISDIHSEPTSILQASSHHVYSNGTFTKGAYPYFGYNAGIELRSKRLRRKYGLPPEIQTPMPNQKAATYNTNINGWANFHAIVSTKKGQIALAPGKLIKKWEKGERAYFEYKTEKPILHFYNFLSGKYKVYKEKYCGVELEIYYLPEHYWNIKRIMKGLKASLKYHIDKLTPYPHTILRIVEFPSFLGSFAQSFATNIAFSESIGFLVREREKDIPVPVFVTAHETGHQWWAHQLISAYTKGESFLMESFAEYGAIRIMEVLNGKNTVGKFLKYELDKYLKSRASFVNNEEPSIYSFFPAIYYNKGSLITYATSDLIGVDLYESIQKRFVEIFGYKNNPYPTVINYLNLLYPSVKSELLSIVKAWHEKVIVYKFKINSAKIRENNNSTYHYSVKYSAKKFLVSENGKEKEIKLNEPIDIGIFKNEELLFRKRETIKDDENIIEFDAPIKGDKIAIDPLYTRVNLLWKNAKIKIK